MVIPLLSSFPVLPIIKSSAFACALALSTPLPIITRPLPSIRNASVSPEPPMFMVNGLLA